MTDLVSCVFGVCVSTEALRGMVRTVLSWVAKDCADELFSLLARQEAVLEVESEGGDESNPNDRA